jgi:DNA-binding MarR family transcriptional regulator
MDVLGALREFRRADEQMRRRMSASLGVNPLDMRALQLVIAAEREHSPLSPSDLSSALQVTSAATTKLVDRLIASGHVARSPHPSDRRSVLLAPTPHAHRTLRRHMRVLHERMAEAAEAVPPDCRDAVVSFLRAMTEVLTEVPNTSAARRG